MCPVSSTHSEIGGGRDSCCIGFTGRHKSMFKESKVACQDVMDDARDPSGKSYRHCMTCALCSYRQDLIAAECGHKALHSAWKFIAWFTER